MTTITHARKRLLKSSGLLTALIIISLISTAQNFPNGFARVTVASTINSPTNMTFAPDGRLFVCEQTGKLRVIKNGVLLNRAFITLSVDASGERGLLGVTFDPDFSNTHWVYLYYTRPDGSNNRIIRVKASGDTAVKNTIETVLDLDPLSSATNHNGGSIKFGKDGKLYVAVGENANGANSQDLNTYLGKLLRINADGSVPPGNPYNTGSEQKKRIWCYGLRNPFTFAVQPLTGKIFVDDVGLSTWEEINDATESKKNFGWPNAEGRSNNPAYTNPLFQYNHSGDPDKTGCAITGGTFFSPANTNYPVKYQGNYFFLDLCNNWINRLDLNDTLRHVFATNVGGSNVSMATGPDGNLYFMSRDNGAVYKIVYSGGAPTAETQAAKELQAVNLLAYPSPANAEITIETKRFNTENTLIKIFDAKGVLIKQMKVNAEKTLINTSALPKGFYFLLATDGVNTGKIKVEIMH